MTPIARDGVALQPESVIRIRALKTWFPVNRGVFRRTVGYIKAVDGVDLDVHEGETLGLVGESGCGKSTLGFSIMRLVEPREGEIWFRQNGQERNILSLPHEEMKSLYRHLQVVFQDPFSSMNPRLSVGEVIAEPLRIHRLVTGNQIQERVRELLKCVGLHPSNARRYPNAFSGGQRQRIVLARALAMQPKVIIADEPVSALDVSVQSQILNLMNELKRKMGLTYVLISHNLNVVRYMSDRIAVMYLGKVVELASSDVMHLAPRHPYTESLLSAIPFIDPDRRLKKKRIILEGDVPDPSHPPEGCRFHTRCLYVQNRCRIEEPQLEEVATGHFAACHFSRELSLAGVKEKDHAH